MFLPVKVETKEYRFVIDTGNAVTIISSSAFNEILTYIDLDLCPTDPGFRIVGADTKISNGAKIRNRYNQVPHLTQDTNGKVTNSQKTPQTRAKRSALSQQVTTKHI